jgi:DNA-binding NarL/FixJ family response regulator
VVDPHPALVELVSDRLEAAGFDVVARATSADAALRAAARFRPDVVVGDPSLCASTGQPVLTALRAEVPWMRIVAFADAAELGPAETAILAGVDAIVAKQSSVDELVQVAQAPGGGGQHVGRPFGEAVSETGLTTRERVTLRLLADGLNYREISARVGVAPETVRVHAAQARRRLGATTRTHAVATALRTKLID